MNSLSKVLAVFCLLFSALAYAEWRKMHNASEVSDPVGGYPVSVATSADGKIVYVGRAGQVFKSTDGGETWAVLK